MPILFDNEYKQRVFKKKQILTAWLNLDYKQIGNIFYKFPYLLYINEESFSKNIRLLFSKYFS